MTEHFDNDSYRVYRNNPIDLGEDIIYVENSNNKI